MHPPRLDEAAIEKMAAWLSDVHGAGLVSLVLYGPALAGGHHAALARPNLLLVLADINAEALGRGAAAVRWWVGEGYPPPVILSAAEQAASGDVFPIEYLDIQRLHRVLRGADLFAGPLQDGHLHRLQVERELRTHLIRLRQGFQRSFEDGKALAEMMLHSAPAFITLFRHALVAVGEPFVVAPDEVVAAVGRRFGCQTGALEEILAARRENTKLGKDKSRLHPLFDGYLAAIQTIETRLEAEETTHA